LSAHESLLKAKNLLKYLPNMVKVEEDTLDAENNFENKFVELGSSWRAPFYEITVCFQKPDDIGKEDVLGRFHGQRTSFPLFNGQISVEVADEAEGEFQNRRYILPRESCFSMVTKWYSSLLHLVSANEQFTLIAMNFFCMLLWVIH
jgi:hypothetical protein